MLCQLPGISAFLISTRPRVTLCGWQAVKIRLLTIISAILSHSASFSKPLFKHKSLLVSLQSIKGVIVRSLPLHLGTQWVKHKKECVIAINQKFTTAVGDSVSQTQEGVCYCNQPEVYYCSWGLSESNTRRRVSLQSTRSLRNQYVWLFSSGGTVERLVQEELPWTECWEN